MPTVLRVGKYRFFFFSNEGHEPIHIHVESGEKYAKFWLSPISLASSVGFRDHELTEIHGLARRHARLFEERWNEYFAS
jgi:hypothetical protein